MASQFMTATASCHFPSGWSIAMRHWESECHLWKGRVTQCKRKKPRPIRTPSRFPGKYSLFCFVVFCGRSFKVCDFDSWAWIDHSHSRHHLIIFFFVCVLSDVYVCHRWTTPIESRSSSFGHPHPTQQGLLTSLQWSPRSRKRIGTHSVGMFAVIFTHSSKEEA